MGEVRHGRPATLAQLPFLGSLSVCPDICRIRFMKLRVIERVNRDLWVEIGVEAVAGLYVVAVVVFCWSRPASLSLLLAAGLCGQFWVWRERVDVATMAVAAMLGAPAEILCVSTGVWTYNSPGLVWGIPIWIPLVWAYLLCMFRRMSITIHSFTLEVWPADRSRLRKLLFGVAGAAIILYSLTTVAMVKVPIAATYIVAMISAIIVWHGERDILIFLVGATFGTLGECICMKLGFWEYQFPLLRSIGVPLSLPLAWGLSSVIIGRFAGKLAKRKPSEQTREAQVTRGVE